jgi:hypothetical protein
MFQTVVFMLQILHLCLIREVFKISLANMWTALILLSLNFSIGKKGKAIPVAGHEGP